MIRLALVVGIMVVLVAPASHAAFVEFRIDGTLAGTVTTPAPCGLCLPRNADFDDQTFEFVVRGDTADVQSRKIGGIRTYWLTASSASVTLQGIRTVNLEDVLLSARPGVHSISLSWDNGTVAAGASVVAIGQSFRTDFMGDTQTRSLVSFSGATTFLRSAPIVDEVITFFPFPGSGGDFLFESLSFILDGGPTNGGMTYAGTSFSNLTYSETVVPLPPSVLFLASGLFLFRWLRVAA